MKVRRILYPDGGFVLNGHVWKIGRPGWCPTVKTPVWVQVYPDFPENAELYRDRECTERVGIATRRARL